MSSDSESSTPDPVDLRRAQERNDRFIVELVMNVEQNPILYDHKHPNYRNVEKKIETWADLKERLRYLGDVQELADYWKIIRDRYTKARRKAILKMPTKFKFLNECSFLNPHITDRSSTNEKLWEVPEPIVPKPTKSSTWTDPAFYVSLILKVKEHPCFYDNNDPNYRRFQFKVVQWRQIAQELDFTGNHTDIYKQWKKLRDRYVREVRKLRVSGKPKDNCRWEHFKIMDWMEPFIEEQRPLEEYEVLVEREDGQQELVRQVRNVKPKKKKTKKMPNLEKIGSAEPISPNSSIAGGENRTPEDVSTSSDDYYEEPTPKKRCMSANSIKQGVLPEPIYIQPQQQPQSTFYVMSGTASQLQILDQQGRVLPITGQIITTPTAQIIFQQSVPTTQYIIAQPTSVVQTYNQVVSTPCYIQPVVQETSQIVSVQSTPATSTLHIPQEVANQAIYYDNEPFLDEYILANETVDEPALQTENEHHKEQIYPEHSNFPDDNLYTTMDQSEMEIPDDYLVDETDLKLQVGIMNNDYYFSEEKDVITREEFLI